MSPAAACIVVALTLEGAALAVLLRAGRLYVRGDLDRSRRIARRAGLAAAAAALAATMAIAAARGAGFPAALAAGSGIAALLAGLAGKPRPTGEAAAALWLAALVSLLGGW